ncbi:uncharacterized protein LOC122029744 [Zingiber officinale]|uniref:Uncharacterized protein n=1 Tax=Zingiber officinale TaxID=94328 RepID=A0A8J5BH72_ZINOF|nr:uncharacterized protein LOC122029744 [Zingiber officinale]KAG6472081.1 hypothetical protein ZIOFF_069536 [Zingiber officinale]
MAVEEEYDVSFAELSKQISLLIMDDDKGELHAQFPQLPRQIIVPPYYGFEAACRRESRGTGVFIPRAAVPRRKNKSRKPIQADIGQEDSKTPPAGDFPWRRQ